MNLEIPNLNPVDALVAAIVGYIVAQVMEWAKRNPNFPLRPDQTALIRCLNGLAALLVQLGWDAMQGKPMDLKTLGLNALLVFVSFVSAEITYHQTLKVGN